jgi:hypothetical protein
MTRKDFELIAVVISNLVARQKDAGAFANNPELKEVAEELAIALAATNPLFNQARFLSACGVK